MIDFEETFMMGVHGKKESPKSLGLMTLIVITGTFHVHSSSPIELIIGIGLFIGINFSFLGHL